MSYLLDTNACLDFLLGRSALVAARIERHFTKLSVSMITVAELRVGNRTSQDPVKDARNVELFLSTIVKRDFDGAAAVAYGDLIRRAEMRRSSFDRLIAAHALALGFTLVTGNESHFADVPGLKIENWAK